MKYQNQSEYWIRGEFEAMYQDIDDPWGCHANSDSLENKIFRSLILENDRQSYKKVLDIGCGMGDGTHRLFCSLNKAHVTGIDISATAIEKAVSKYPDLKFETKNIMVEQIGTGFDLVILSEVLWYILDDLNGVWMKILSSLQPNGILAIKQYFPDCQKYGNQIIDGLADFENFLSSYENNLNVIYSIVINPKLSGENSGKILLAKVQKKCD